MAKWNSDKFDEEIEKAEKENHAPPVPVTTTQLPKKMTKEEKIRRYDRG